MSATENARVVPLTVERLRERLADLPDRHEVWVSTIVGGDLVTDDVALMDVSVAGGQDVYVRLLPDPTDQYDTRTLIDDGIALRAGIERLLENHGDCFAGMPIHQVANDECVDDCTGCCADEVIDGLRELIANPECVRTASCEVGDHSYSWPCIKVAEPSTSPGTTDGGA